ncbi:molecular chaperone SurA [Alkalilimnicola sp. S0819]|nr:molecular chaperone SurA [Alkalilimnicola sp. S0819]MPQ17242.1 molecular chaperone SurA [Alkalilimnicola sp. S0819]
MRFLAGLALSLALGTAVAETLDRIVAVVDDKVVLASELESETALVRQRLRQQKVNLPSPQVLERQVLDRLIMERLQLAVAGRMGIRVDEGTLNAALQRIADQNGMSLSRFRDAVQAQGMDYAAFREDLRDEITIRRLRERRVRTSVNVTPQEVEELLNNARGEDSTEYLLGHILIALPERPEPEQIRAARAEADETIAKLRAGQSMDAVAAAHSDSGTALEGGNLGWRTAARLPTIFAQQVQGMSPGEIRGPIEAGNGLHIIQLLDSRDGDRKLVTQTRARHILIRTNEVVSDSDARTRLNTLRQRIDDGADFAELARQHSEDPGSGVRGGDLGWVNPGTMVTVFEQQMDRLQPGELSLPFESQFGWHLVQVLERREQDMTQEMRRAQATAELRERKAEEALEAWLRRIRDEAYVDIRLGGE